ncbi:MAG: FKBP-type peptidyl-prolyl cis-trans isomerase SlyD [Halobacteriales archaeon]|jgi:FKBP-type peptidyl-prolyl cis-trans isomerase SlyD
MVASQFVPLSFLMDGGNRVESEPFENIPHRFSVLDVGFEFLTGLRFGLDEWPFIRYSGGSFLVGVFSPDSEGFVGFPKIPVRVRIVGVFLNDPTEATGVRPCQTFTKVIVVGSHLDLDLIHICDHRLRVTITVALWHGSPYFGERDSRSGRITMLKCGTTEVYSMTDDQEAENTEAEPEEESPDQSGLQDGEFVKLDYTARTVDEGTLVDTTHADVAEEEGVEDQDRDFEPRTLILGEQHIFEAVEEDVKGRELGESGSVIVPGEEAFGEYENDKVRTISAEKIDEDDRYPGAQVQVDGEQGYVETVIGGRARVDFNHPLAGEDIEYEYEIVDVVEDRHERAKGLFRMYLEQDLEMWIESEEVEEEQLVEPDEAEAEDEHEEPPEPEYETVTVEKESLYVEATPELAMDQQWMFSKQQIAEDVMEKLDLDRVVVQEVIDGGMGGMMGGMGGMMGGGMGGGDVEEALDDADVDAEDIVEELEEDGGE